MLLRILDFTIWALTRLRNRIAPLQKLYGYRRTKSIREMFEGQKMAELWNVNEILEREG